MLLLNDLHIVRVEIMEELCLPNVQRDLKAQYWLYESRHQKMNYGEKHIKLKAAVYVVIITSCTCE